MRWVLTLVMLLLGCATRDGCPSGDLVYADDPIPAYAVLRSDYSSSAITLLGADGAVVDVDFVDSGTRVSTLVTSLSADAVLPSTPLGHGRVAWIDRGLDLVTTSDTFANVVQIGVRGDAGDVHSDLWANPQDAILVGDVLFVSRYGVSPDATEPLHRGDDVVSVVDGIVQGRIEIDADEPLAPTACTGSRCLAYARPSVLLPMDVGPSGVPGAILVVLDRMTLDFHHAGTSAVVTIDPITREVSPPTLLDGLQNCTFAVRAPDGAAFVLCLGPVYEADGQRTTEETRRAHAGIARVTLGGGGLAFDYVLAPGSSAPVPSNGLVALADGRVLYVANGSLLAGAEVPDRLVDLSSSGFASTIYEADTAFVLGEGVPLAGGTTALVPDASRSVLLEVTAPPVGVATVTGAIPLDDCVDLPPRQIRPLAF